MAFHWTKAALRALIWSTLDGAAAVEIAARLGCAPHTVQAMQLELKLKKAGVRGQGSGIGRRLQKRRFWNENEKAVVREEYAETATAEIAKRLGRPVGQVYQAAARLGVKKSRAFLAALGKEKLLAAGAPYRFAPGHPPANKGLRHARGWAPGRMAETQFKKGERRGKAAENWKPVGTISIDTQGVRRIKVREALPGEAYGSGNVKAWPLLNRWIWKQAHGPIPPGYKIAFIDGDRGNCEPENLEIISEAEMMRRNSVHNLPKELADVIQLAGALKRKLRTRMASGN